MNPFNYIGIFMGAGLIGYALKIKDWKSFLVIWVVILTLVHDITGIQTQPGYYVGITKDPKYV